MTNLMAVMPFHAEAALKEVYWLCEWMRDTAAVESLIKLREKQKNPAQALHFALSVAVKNARAEANRSLIYAIEDGNLLFAHATSTRLSRPVTGAAA